MATAATNYWPDTRCAKAFWGQHDLPPYRQLLADTVEWADPGPGERWLDLGCGGGAITRALWEHSGGAVAEVVGADCAAANAHAYARLRDELAPAPGHRVRFICHDFSGGLSTFADGAGTSSSAARPSWKTRPGKISRRRSCGPSLPTWG